jgi:hypothetical protein
MSGNRGRGRPKGVPNKHKIPNVQELLEANNFNPIEHLIKLATESEEKAIQLGATKEICKYAYPQLKAVETKIEFDNMPNVFKIVKA